MVGWVVKTLMGLIMKRLAFGFALLCGLSVSAVAQKTQAPAASPSVPAASAPAQGAVKVELVQRKVVKDERGVEKLVDADSVRPGDVVQYSATYTNTSLQAVSGLVGELPIPDGLEYEPKSARPAGDLVKFATKDGLFASEPLMRASKPGVEPQRVPLNEYRTIRWQLGRLPAGGVTSVTARAKVEVAAPISAAGASNSASQAPPAAK